MNPLRRSLHTLTLALTIASSALVVTAAHAAPPWVDGVAEKDQKRATALFDEGNALLRDAFFTRAVDRYRQALALWDHPSIHFNMAKALLQLDDPVAAYDAFWSALRFGGQPLAVDQVEQALTYTKLVYNGEVTHLAVACDEPNLEVTIAKRAFGTARWEGLVRFGPTEFVLTSGKRELARVSRLLSSGRRVDVTCAKRGGVWNLEFAERASTEADMVALARKSPIFPKQWPIDIEALRKLEAAHAGDAPDRLAANEGRVDAKPANIAAICAKAKRDTDLGTVCEAFDATWSEVTRMRQKADADAREAIRKLREVTRGGLVESLK